MWIFLRTHNNASQTGDNLNLTSRSMTIVVYSLFYLPILAIFHDIFQISKFTNIWSQIKQILVIFAHFKYRDPQLQVAENLNKLIRVDAIRIAFLHEKICNVLLFSVDLTIAAYGSF